MNERRVQLSRYSIIPSPSFLRGQSQALLRRYELGVDGEQHFPKDTPVITFLCSSSVFALDW